MTTFRAGRRDGSAPLARSQADVGRETKMLRKCCLTAAALAALAACGCQNGTGVSGDGTGAGGAAPKASPGLLPQVNPPISDVPVPIGFDLDEQKSRNYAVQGMRMVDHLYLGRAGKFALKQFYERYMVLNQWTLASFVYAQGTIALDFVKPGERCRITIEEGSFFSSSKVIVVLGPDKTETRATP